MAEYVQRCAPLARRFSIGSSAVDRQPLWVLEISDNPGVQEPEPNFKYVANMHGDETSGRALLPLLAEWLCEHHLKDERAARIVRDMHLFIMPTMNPDGFTRRSATTGTDPQESCQPNLEVCQPASLTRGMNSSAPEAQAVMRWSLPANARKLRRRSTSTSSSSSVPAPPRNARTFHFTAAANLHEGATAAGYHASPDDATFRFLASAYAEKHTWMADPLQNSEFVGGITNGAAWYDVVDGIRWRTHADGYFGFYARPIKPGAYRVRATYPGFRAAVAQVVVPEDMSGVVQNLVLHPPFDEFT
ncbi:putative carboxypeptidase [Scenedesmus sp. NREL 46B-D3]|nr:putative carboxypeptidase [Scenedesmus sp. NREL 46B-D3]